MPDCQDTGAVTLAESRTRCPASGGGKREAELFSSGARARIAMKCPRCATQVSPGAKWCTKCGITIEYDQHIVLVILVWVCFVASLLFLGGSFLYGFIETMFRSSPYGMYIPLIFSSFLGVVGAVLGFTLTSRASKLGARFCLFVLAANALLWFIGAQVLWQTYVTAH